MELADTLAVVGNPLVVVAGTRQVGSSLEGGGTHMEEGEGSSILEGVPERTLGEVFVGILQEGDNNPQAEDIPQVVDNLLDVVGNLLAVDNPLVRDILLAVGILFVDDIRLVVDILLVDGILQAVGIL